jgi:hypothetical protein
VNVLAVVTQSPRRQPLVDGDRHVAPEVHVGIETAAAQALKQRQLDGVAAITRLVNGNFRLTFRLTAQIGRILDIKCLSVVTREVVEAGPRITRHRGHVVGSAAVKPSLASGCPAR